MKDYLINISTFIFSLIIVRLFFLFEMPIFLKFWVLFFIFLCFIQFFTTNGKISYFIYLATIVFFSPKIHVFDFLTGYSVYYSDTPSNYPTIQNDDLIVGRIFGIRFERGEMISFKTKLSEQDFVKRIHGIPGDHITLCNSEVYVNGYSFKKINNWQPVKFSEENRCSSRRSSFFLKEDEYFVLGDNHMNSFDSRKFGPIVKRDIVSTKIYLIRDNDYKRPISLSVLFSFPSYNLPVS
ncbi:signal peptidase I [Alishewanella longhuensis]